MKNILFIILAMIISQNSHSQIKGTIRDSLYGDPIPYVNVWVQNTMIGGTSNEKGVFEIEKAHVNDSLYVSCLGYKSKKIIAQEFNTIKLAPQINELDEVVVKPIYSTIIKEITSYKRVKKRRYFYHNGFYTLARLYKYSSDYDATPFIRQVSIITRNGSGNETVLKVSLVKAGSNGAPSENELAGNLIVHVSRGLSETKINFDERQLVFPEEGFFVMVERLDMEQNRSKNSSNLIIPYILQPAIGMSSSKEEDNTWLGFGGKWISPENIGEYIGFENSNSHNMAINIKLSN